MCNPVKYPNVTREDIGRMIASLKKQGISVQGNVLHNTVNGLVEGKGIRAKISWTGEFRVLVVIVEKKPWYVSCKRIYKEVERYLRHDKR